ncbi:hypothetical protein [Sphingobacterium suaedae]|uniref:Uncharacterized protein n=1 Tax=Sphingobacterium suaedae TaxID=1686402 RepID=A0ABW5KGE8_9SPHI
MPVNFNDTPSQDLGLFFKKGGLYGELLKLPKPKERYSYDWKDEHGKEYDTFSPTVYESLQYNIPCYLVANDVDDLQAKRTAILELISAPAGFDFYSNTLGRGFKLRYIDSPSFRTMNPIWSKGKLYCEFTLVFENNFDPTITQFALADEYNFIVTENDEQIIVEDYKQHF